jgi:membrane fusion protein, multidrug efflux system
MLQFSLRKVLLTTAALGTAAGAYAIFAPSSDSADKAKAANGPAGGGKPTPVVKAMAITASPLAQTLQITGNLLANEEVELRSEISGRVTSLNFTEGTNVAKGALLVKINDADLRATLKKLKVQEALAAKEESRSRQLLEQKLLSVEEYDAALNKLETVKAEIEKTESDIAKTELRAPFSGTVGLRYISNGSTVSPTTLIARVQQMDPMKIEFTVPEKYAGSLRVGSPISFTVAGLEQRFSGKVYAIEPKIDAATRTLRLRALAPNPGRVLVPGAFAKVELELSRMEEAISVPTSSVIPHIDGQMVYVLKDGKAVSRNVTTGVRNDSSVQITDGLAPGDTVITSGLLQLREGSKVKIAE